MAFKLLKFPCYLCPNVSFFPLKTSICTHKFTTNIIQCSMNEQNLHSRRSGNYKPSIWSYDFLQSLHNDNVDEWQKQKAKKLGEEVRCLIKNEREEMLKRLELIDDIQRMGMRHIFEEEIKEAIDTIVTELGGIRIGIIISSKSLHFTALLFRLARQHGYDVSQDVFKGFMDQNGDIEEHLKMDAEGILSLYEASYLSIEGEELLDKARKQTFKHLNDLLQNINSALQIVERISHAIDLPLNRKMVMLEAHFHIQSYSKRTDKNHSLLELAKLNFNIVQSLLQTELKEMSRKFVKALTNLLEFLSQLTKT